MGADPAFGQQRGRRGVEGAAGDGGAVALFDEAIHQLVGERTRRRPFVAGAGVDAKNMGHREYSFLLPGEGVPRAPGVLGELAAPGGRSEEHTSELQSLMRISYAVFCVKKKIKKQTQEEHVGTNNKT